MKTLTVLALVFATVLMSSPFEPIDEALKAKSQLLDQSAKKLLKANAEVTENQSRFDVLWYGIDLDIDPGARVISGSVSMTVRILAEINSIELNMLNGLTVNSTSVNYKSAQFEKTDQLLTIYLDETAKAGELITVQTYYYGTPLNTGLGGFAFDSYGGSPLIWTLSEPYAARSWWPCKDAPVDKADSVDIRITVPEGLIVASNGSLAEKTTANGKTTFLWQERYPIVTYLVSLAIHPYYFYQDEYINAENDTMPVEFYVFPNHVDNVRETYALTVPMITFYSENFGEYPFLKEKYGHAEFGWGGGMEHQTITSLGGSSESLIVHELAHQWWGDMITCKSFHHIWLNEGFATYCEALWWESIYGAEGLHADMRRKTFKGSGTIYIEDPAHENIFDYSLTYAKASWVLHMLRHVVGEETFWQILQTYYAEFKFKTATTEQFQELCERVSGLNLHDYFQQWIYGPGYPQYEYYYQSQNKDNGYQTFLEIKQTQNTQIFNMPIDVLIEFEEGDTLVVVQNYEQKQDYTLFTQQEPVNIVIDPENWIIKDSSPIKVPNIQIVDSIYFQQGEDSIKHFQPGENYTIQIPIANTGIDADNVEISLSSNVAGVTIAQDSFNLGMLLHNQPSTLVTFKITIEAGTPSQIAEFSVKILAFVGSEGYRQSTSFKIPIGSPILLFVDDDLGMTYESFYAKMADEANIYATLHDINSSGLPALDDLLSFNAVVWFTGDDRTTTFTADEQELVKAYLQNGGRLMISGQGIGEDLSTGPDEDLDFLQNILHAEITEPAAEQTAIVGMPTDVLGDNLMIRLQDIYDAAGNQTAVGELAAISPAIQFLMYLPLQTGAGLRVENTQELSKLIFLPFGMEGIEGPTQFSSSLFLNACYLWLIDNLNDVKDENSLPQQFLVAQNHPNPFNPSTTIKIECPGDGQLDVDIVNILGQRVYSQHIQARSGFHQFNWNGRDHSGSTIGAGLYFAHISYRSQNVLENKTIKMIKLP